MGYPEDIRTGRHCVFACHAHLVFVTKYRRGVFTDELLKDCESAMTDTCTKAGCELVTFNGEHDHVHLLINFPPTIQLSKLVNSLKGASSRRLRNNHPDHINQYLWGDHFWSRSYYTITAYINNQRRPTT